MPMDPPCQCPPPPSRKKKHGPPSYPLPKEGTSPPRDFFTKLHTNCPFLPSFLIVQWHVMGTILGVMCLVFNTDFHFSKCSKSPMEQTERLSGRSCPHFVKPSTWPCWPEPMCTIACFRGTKVSGLRKGLHPARLFLLISSGVHCFTKSHTNCPFLPSFLSVQWHVMGTILRVMRLVFNTDFHFSKCSKSPMEQTEIVW